MDRKPRTKNERITHARRSLEARGLPTWGDRLTQAALELDGVRPNWVVGDVIALRHGPNQPRYVVADIHIREDGAVGHDISIAQIRKGYLGARVRVAYAETHKFIPIQVFRYHPTDGHLHRGLAAYRRRMYNYDRWLRRHGKAPLLDFRQEGNDVNNTADRKYRT